MATFEFKCRRCGAIDLNPHCNSNMAFEELCNIMAGRTSARPQAPSLYGFHLCKDGGVGLTDLQGYRVEELQPAEEK